MTSENTKDSTDEYPTKFTNVKTQEDISINQTLLKVELGKPAKLIEGVKGFNNTTLTRYLRMKIWTLLECALLAGGVLPKDEYTEIPNSAIGLQNKWLEEGNFQLREARRILIDLRRDSMPDEISPTTFFAWLKSRPDPEFHALRWLSAIEELKSETITVIGATEIKEQLKESVEQQQETLRISGDSVVSQDVPNRRKLWDIVTPYIIQIIQTEQCASAKELFRALEKKAGQNSPFDKGTGNNRDSLFVREISKAIVLKTLQNNWQRLRTKASKK